MREIRIRKRSGGYRVVVCPGRRLRRYLRGTLPQAEATAMAVDVHGVQHGFVPCRSPVSNAWQHVGPYRFTVTWDLADCFDHVTRRKVAEVLGTNHPLIWDDRCWVRPGLARQDRDYWEAVARQGLPTSPALANIALAPLDAAIMRLVAELRADGERAVYSRYADDLAVSCQRAGTVGRLLRDVPALCRQAGFPVNARKTRVQSARRGRRVVTGVAVDERGAYPTRRAKRRLRAALHQRRQQQAAGLAAWCRLRRPNVGRWLTARLGRDHRGDADVLLALVAQRELKSNSP